MGIFKIPKEGGGAICCNGEAGANILKYAGLFLFFFTGFLGGPGVLQGPGFFPRFTGKQKLSKEAKEKCLRIQNFQGW